MMYNIVKYAFDNLIMMLFNLIVGIFFINNVLMIKKIVKFVKKKLFIKEN